MKSIYSPLSITTVSLSARTAVVVKETGPSRSVAPCFIVNVTPLPPNPDRATEPVTIAVPPVGAVQRITVPAEVPG